jgi:hypothetical protein
MGFPLLQEYRQYCKIFISFFFKYKDTYYWLIDKLCKSLLVQFFFTQKTFSEVIS